MWRSITLNARLYVYLFCYEDVYASMMDTGLIQAQSNKIYAILVHQVSHSYIIITLKAITYLPLQDLGSTLIYIRRSLIR